jgi:all-trans-retinol dehydrogenase (NAD+)
MIERKRGHIVAISSMGGQVTFPPAITYCASKFGVRGFMSALYDELCMKDHDELIKLTTVYPSFINTRKELTEILSPGYVAHVIVKGMLHNKSEIILPPVMKLIRVLK